MSNAHVQALKNGLRRCLLYAVACLLYIMHLSVCNTRASVPGGASIFDFHSPALHAHANVAACRVSTGNTSHTDGYQGRKKYACRGAV